MSTTQNGTNDGKQDAPPAGGALGKVGSLLQGLSSAKDGGRYRGVLSYAAEWHSAVLGLAVGVAGSPAMGSALIAYALGRGGGRRIKNDAAHVRDVTDEPAYALAGLVLGRALSGSALPLQAIQSLGGMV